MDAGETILTSAHPAGAQSELVIPFWHGVQEMPPAILEIRCILRLDIDSTSEEYQADVSR